MAPVWNHDNVRNKMWLVNTLSTHETLTRCWSNAEPPSATLARLQTALIQRLLFAGRSIAAGLVVLTAGGDYKLTPTHCLLNVAGAGRYPMDIGQHQRYYPLVLVSTTRRRLQTDTDPLSVKCRRCWLVSISPSQYFMLAVPARCFEPKLV